MTIPNTVDYRLVSLALSLSLPLPHPVVEKNSKGLGNNLTQYQGWTINSISYSFWWILKSNKGSINGLIITFFYPVLMNKEWKLKHSFFFQISSKNSFDCYKCFVSNDLDPTLQKSGFKLCICCKSACFGRIRFRFFQVRSGSCFIRLDLDPYFLVRSGSIFFSRMESGSSKYPTRSASPQLKTQLVVQSVKMLFLIEKDSRRRSKEKITKLYSVLSLMQDRYRTNICVT